MLHGGTIASWLTAAAVVVTLVACAGRARLPSAATRRELATAEAALGDHDYPRASAAYDRAVAGAPDGPSLRLALRERADARLFTGDLAGAEADLTALAAAAPDDPAAWHDLGIVRANLGAAAGAGDALRHAKALAPDDPRPRLALAALAWSGGDRARAQAEYRALLTLELAPRVRAKIEWALTQLATP
ncbi:MAG: hypothetical protein R3B06_19165 [Kofleriaceae bacterium]